MAGPRRRRWVALLSIMHYVYILKSEVLGKYYVGYTSNLEKRIKDHNAGRSVFTKNGVPWKIVYSETLEDRKSAWLREHQIKSYKSGEAFKKLIKHGGVA